MKIGICDDDRQDCQKIQDICLSVMEKKAEEYEIYVFQDGKEIFESQHSLDLLILDIEMQEMDGIEVKQKMQMLGQQTLIIFVSSHDDLVLSAFGVYVYGFVQKEQIDSQFIPMLESALDLMCQNVWIEDSINSRSVKYIMADRNYCVLVMINGEKKIMRNTIQVYEELLRQAGFVKVHKSYLVNLKCVTKLSKNEVVLGREVIPVAARMRAKVEKSYQEFCERNARYR